MIELILAYVIAFLLSPTIGAIAGLLFLPLVFLIDKIGIPFSLFRGVTSVVIGFVTVWFATIVFSWFAFQPTLLMVVILGFGFVSNDYRRISHSSEANVSSEIAAAVGNLLGVVVGGVYFL